MEYNTHDRQRSYYRHREEELDEDTMSQLQDELDESNEYYEEETPPIPEERHRQPNQELTFLNMFFEITNAFMEGWRLGSPIHKQEKRLRDHLSEKQIDKMVEDSFPSSDPPSTY